MSTSGLLELFVSSLITFFVVIDPPGCAPIYAGLSAGATPTHRRTMAVRAVGVAAALDGVFEAELVLGEGDLGAGQLQTLLGVGGVEVEGRRYAEAGDFADDVLGEV